MYNLNINKSLQISMQGPVCTNKSTIKIKKTITIISAGYL